MKLDITNNIINVENSSQNSYLQILLNDLSYGKSGHNQTVPSNISSNANNTVEKGSPQLPILFVVQKSDHVGQENVIGLLTTKENTN